MSGKNSAALFWAISLSLLTASHAFAQAFGIGKGTPLDELSVERESGNGVYVVDVPNPHPEFDFFTVTATPELGVCEVVGYGKSHENDGYGLSVQRAFEDLLSPLRARYGDHAMYDFLRTGALWDESDEWVMAIRQNERVYQAWWDEEEGSDLPEGLQEIVLTTFALSSSTSYVTLAYWYDNKAECDAERAQVTDSGL